MRAWLAAIGLLVCAIAAGWLYLLNPDAATVHLGPRLARQAPLGVLLAAAFAAGAAAMLLVGAAGALRRVGQAWRARRAAAARASTARARALVWSGATTLARQELGRRGDPATHPEHAGIVAQSHLDDDQPGEARRVLEAALAVAPPTPELLDLLATAAGACGDGTAAIAALERARALRPESPRLLRRLRDAYVAAGRAADAVPLQGELVLAARTAERLADEAARLHRIRVAAATADADDRRAARALAALAAEAPGESAAWLAAGDRWARAGEPRRARRAWVRGLLLAPDAALLARLVVHDAASGHPEHTRRTLRRLRRRLPDDAVLALGDARLLLEAGAHDDAARVLDALPADVAALPAAHALRGALCAARGDTAGAAEAYSHACEPGLGGPSGRA